MKSRLFALSIAAVALPILFSGCASQRESAPPLFRFMQINDTHVASEAKRSYAKANEKARWLVAAANGGAYFPRPDFVIGVGDLIEGDKIEYLAPDLRVFQEIIAPLRAPFHPVMGNHEVVQREGVPEYEKPYRDAFGPDRANYTFTHKGLLFIALSNPGAGCGSLDPAVSRARTEWLRRQLDGAPETPKIIFCHVPFVLSRDEKVFAESFGFRNYMDRDPDALQLIERHADTVIAVLNGHHHLTGMALKNGIYHITVSGSSSYPCDYAIYGVYPDRIEVAVKQLPANLVTPTTNIHGRPRHPQDYTDSLHKTPHDYLFGLPSERSFTIPLHGKKHLPQ